MPPVLTSTKLAIYHQREREREREREIRVAKKEDESMIKFMLQMMISWS